MSKDDIKKLKEDVDSYSALVEKEQVFCPAKVGIGFCKLLTSSDIWVFVIFTVFFVLKAPKDDWKFWLIYGVLGIAFMFFKPLSKLIERGNMNVNLGSQLNADIAEIIKSKRGEKND